jgi:hypothetical protein
MPRIRSLKPDFFKDEDLAELQYWQRLLFAGLWCLADKDGRLQDRPRRIKSELFPYDDKININSGLDALASPKLHSPKHPPFIVRYEVDGERYIQILSWQLHQNPHHTEKDGVIPAFNGSLTVNEPFLKGATGDAHYPEPMNKNQEPRTKKDNGPAPPEFAGWWTKYPRKLGKQDALQVYVGILKTSSPDDLTKALDNYLTEIATNKTEEKYIKHPVTFLRADRWKDYLEWMPKKQAPDTLTWARERLALERAKKTGEPE